MIDHAEAVAGVEQFRRGRIVRGADGVAAEFLQLFHAEFLERIRQRRADAGHVLMVAGAVKFVMLAVQQKSVRRIKRKRADAERGFFLVNHLAADGNRCDELVKFWVFRRPKNRRRNFRFQFHHALRFRFDFFRFGEFFQRLAVGRDDFTFHRRFCGVRLRIEQANLDVDFGIALRNVVPKFAPHKNPVRRDGHRRGFVQPDVAVNARALVKPAFELLASTRTVMTFLPPKCATSVMSSRNG